MYRFRKVKRSWNALQISSLVFGLRWAQRRKSCFVTLRNFCSSTAGQGFQNTKSRHSKSNPIELNFNWTQSVDWVRLSSVIERNRTHRKEKKSIEPNRTFDFRTRDLCKTDVENPLPDLSSSSYFSPEWSARVFRKRRNSAEMASDALWIV